MQHAPRCCKPRSGSSAERALRPSQRGPGREPARVRLKGTFPHAGPRECPVATVLHVVESARSPCFNRGRDRPSAMGANRDLDARRRLPWSDNPRKRKVRMDHRLVPRPHRVLAVGRSVRRRHRDIHLDWFSARRRLTVRRRPIPALRMTCPAASAATLAGGPPAASGQGPRTGQGPATVTT